MIGSFQKDGEGKKNGYVPKFIKGPDILINVLKFFQKFFDYCFTFCSSKGLCNKRTRILWHKYIYSYLNNPDDLYNLYNAIDLYLITSREEEDQKV